MSRQYKRSYYILIKFLLPLFFMTSCMVGPRFQPIVMNTPTTFNEDSSKSIVNLKEWWKTFNDPLLDSLISQAIEKNYGLQIAYEQIVEARSRYNLANANLYPEINAQATENRFKISETLSNSAFLGTPYQNLYMLGFDASWELDFFGKLRHERQAAFYDIDERIASMRGVYLILLADVARNYIEYRGFEERIKVLSKQKKVQEQLLVLTMQLFETGLKSQIDVDSQRAALQQILTTLSTLNTNLKNRLYSLATLLGCFPEELTLPPSHGVPQVRDQVGAGIPSELLRRRPDIQQAEKRFAKETELVGSKIADLFPSISLTGSFTFETTAWPQLFTAPSRAWNIGPNLLLPLLNFGRIRATIDEQKSVQRQALLSYKNSVIEAFKDVENALVAYFDQQKSLAYQEERWRSEKEKSLLTDDLFHSGLQSALSSLEQEKNLLIAEDSLVQTETLLSQNIISLYKSLGGDF